MLTKRFLIPWFGAALPDWIKRYEANTARLADCGWEFIIMKDEDDFRRRCKDILGVTVPPSKLYRDKRKINDLRPGFGAVYGDLLKGCDFWGHTDLDCVYGRLSHFLPDEELRTVDIWSNDFGQICGPFTLYCNTPSVNLAFQQSPEWQQVFQSPNLYVWDEWGFSECISRSALKVSYNHIWMEDARDFADIKLKPDGSLWQHGREIMAYHFNNLKRWPVQ